MPLVKLKMKNKFIFKLHLFLFFILFSSSVTQGQPAQPDTVTLYFAGDVTLANHFEEDVGDSFSYPFARMQWFSDADITMVNLENPITTRGMSVPKEFNFRAHPKYTRMLKDAGIDIVTLGNNHIYDYGDEGVFDTVENLDSLGIKHVGAGRNIEDARQPVIFNVKGIRIAYLGYLGFVKTSYPYFASTTKAGPSLFSIENLKEDIGKLHEVVDYIVVNMHWGVEKNHFPEEHQVYLAHEAIRAGADLIVGHHPHALQGIERYRGKIIAYSLGNFLFGGKADHSYSTVVLKVRIPTRMPLKARASVIPIYVKKWQPYAAEERKAKSILHQIRFYSDIFRDNIFRRRK